MARRALSTLTGLRGLVNPATSVGRDHSGGSKVPLAHEMSKLLKFHPWVSQSSKRKESDKKRTSDRETWDGFDGKAAENKNLLKKVLQKGGCVEGWASSSSSLPTTCDGTYRNLHCDHISCMKLTMVKNEIERHLRLRNLTSESQIHGPVLSILEGLSLLAERVDPKLADQRVLCGPCLREINIQKPDFLVRDKRGEPLVAVELKFPKIKLLSENLRNDPHSLADDYNQQFQRALRKNESRTDDNFEIDALQKAIIQTTFYALSLDNGLAVLHTMNDAVFFQARPRIDLAGKITEIEMLTSRVYPCNPRGNDASAMEAMFAMLMISPDMQKVKNIKQSQRYLDDVVAKEKSKNRKDDEKDDGENRRHGSSAHQGASSSAHQGSSSKSTKKEGKKPKKKKGREDSFLKERSFVTFLISQLILANIDKLPNRFENKKRKERIGMLKSLKRNEYWYLNKAEMEDMFKKHYYEVVGAGVSGTVLRADIGEFPIAIKIWNMNSELQEQRLFPEDPTSLELLEHEIKIYKSLADQYPKLLGDVIPRLYAIAEAGEYTAIVTEYVGHELDRYCLNERSLDSGPFEWYVDGELLSVKDQNQINEAATRAAGALYSRGIIHGDLREDNLRVQRITDENGERNWRVWWVDFGSAKIQKGESYEVSEWKLGSPGVL